MILGVCATLGIFLLLASRNPPARSLISFTAWSSLVDAIIMAMQAFNNTGERGHLLGDVPALIIVEVMLIVLAHQRNRRIGYQELDFSLPCVKDADRDIPILKEAKAEYAKLQ